MVYIGLLLTSLDLIIFFSEIGGKWNKRARSLLFIRQNFYKVAAKLLQSDMSKLFVLSNIHHVQDLSLAFPCSPVGTTLLQLLS